MKAGKPLAVISISSSRKGFDIMDDMRETPIQTPPPQEFILHKTSHNRIKKLVEELNKLQLSSFSPENISFLQEIMENTSLFGLFVNAGGMTALCEFCNVLVMKVLQNQTTQIMQEKKSESVSESRVPQLLDDCYSPVHSRILRRAHKSLNGVKLNKAISMEECAKLLASTIVLADAEGILTVRAKHPYRGKLSKSQTINDQVQGVEDEQHSKIAQGGMNIVEESKKSRSFSDVFNEQLSNSVDCSFSDDMIAIFDALARALLSCHSIGHTTLKSLEDFGSHLLQALWNKLELILQQIGNPDALRDIDWDVKSVVQNLHSSKKEKILWMTLVRIQEKVVAAVEMDETKQLGFVSLVKRVSDEIQNFHAHSSIANPMLAHFVGWFIIEKWIAR